MKITTPINTPYTWGIESLSLNLLLKTKYFLKLFKYPFIELVFLGMVQLVLSLSFFQFETTKYDVIEPSKVYFNFEQAKPFSKDLLLTTFNNFSLHELELAGLNSIPKRLRKRAVHYLPTIFEVAERFQVDPIWVTSVMWVESHFNPKALSHADARGLMQLLPTTADWVLGKMPLSPEEKRDIKMNTIYGPKGNITVGVYYLKMLLKKFDGDHRLATIAYNMGPYWVIKNSYRKKWMLKNISYLTKVNKSYNELSKNFVLLSSSLTKNTKKVSFNP